MRGNSLYFKIYIVVSYLFLSVNSLQNAFLKVYQAKTKDPWTVYSKDCPYGATVDVEIENIGCICLSGLLVAKFCNFQCILISFLSICIHYVSQVLIGSDGPFTKMRAALQQ